MNNIQLLSPFEDGETWFGEVIRVSQGNPDRTRALSEENSGRMEYLPSREIRKPIPLKILCLIYEPVACSICSFLQSLLPDAGTERAADSQDIESIRGLYLASDHPDRIIRWFESVVDTGIRNLLSQAPFSDGHQVIQTEEQEILFLKVTDDRQHMQRILAGFLQISVSDLPAPVTPAGRLAGTGFAGVFHRMVLPWDYLEKIEGSTYVKHFFSPEERGMMIRQFCDFTPMPATKILEPLKTHIRMPLPNLVRHEIERQRFWYVDIPRTSSTSIKAGLGNRFGIAFGKTRILGAPGIDFQLMPNHIPALVFRSMVGHELWDRIFTFTLVRNPWERFLSLYFYRSRLNQLPAGMTFREYVKQMYHSRGSGLFRYRGFYFGNCDYIMDDQGKLLVSYVGKYENRTEELKIIGEKIGCPGLGTEHLQSSGEEREHYSHYYDKETAGIIGNVYARDIEMFQYTFDTDQG